MRNIFPIMSMYVYNSIMTAQLKHFGDYNFHSFSIWYNKKIMFEMTCNGETHKI